MMNHRLSEGPEMLRGFGSPMEVFPLLPKVFLDGMVASCFMFESRYLNARERRKWILDINSLKKDL